jgi:hypothetical protein
MAKEPFIPQLRLVFQCSIPFEEIEHAESWYAMLKEMVLTQSPKSTLNGSIQKLLEPCCGERKMTPYGPVGPQSS